MFIVEQIRTRVKAGMVGIIRKMQRPEDGKRWDGGYTTSIGREHGGLDSMYNNQVLNLDAKVSFAYVRYMPELAFGKAMIEVFINLYMALQLILRRSLCAPSYLSIQEQPHL